MKELSGNIGINDKIPRENKIQARLYYFFYEMISTADPTNSKQIISF